MTKLKINVRSIESDTHTLLGHAEWNALSSGLSIYITGESWHSYAGCPGFQGFERERFVGSYETVTAAERAGWIFGNA